MGVQGEFSGVPMHVGHYCKAMDKHIHSVNPGAAGFFSPLKWRIFVQTSLALRMASLPASTREPCCSLKHIGGDGTGIGIPHVNLNSLSPAWVPPHGTREAVFDWGRMDRCAIGRVDTCGCTSEITEARKYVKQLTSTTCTRKDRIELRSQHDIFRSVLPKLVCEALEAWLVLPETENHWNSMRQLLNACSHQDSLFGIVAASMIPDLQLAIEYVRQGLSSACFYEVLDKLRGQGMGPEICTVLETEMCHSIDDGLEPCNAFIGLIDYIGDEITSTLVIQVFFIIFKLMFISTASEARFRRSNLEIVVRFHDGAFLF